MSSISNLFLSLGPWNWLVLAVVLFGLETLIPGVYLVWFGLAAAFVGGLALWIDITWQWQLILFGGIALASVFAVRQFFASYSGSSDQPDLNVRGKYYMGRIVTVEDAIVNGRGRVRVGDTLWAAEGPDMEPGTRAKVVGINGTVLVIEEL